MARNNVLRHGKMLEFLEVCITEVVGQLVILRTVIKDEPEMPHTHTPCYGILTEHDKYAAV